MTFTLSPWWVWVLASLVLFGACFVVWAAWRGTRAAAGWLADWLQGRIDPPWWWKPWLYRRAEKYDEEPLEELPPERSWEQMTSDRLPLVGAVVDMPRLGGYLTSRGFEPYAVERERRVPPWEVDQRAHYVAMGLEFPSGLMARVRELTP